MTKFLMRDSMTSMSGIRSFSSSFFTLSAVRKPISVLSAFNNSLSKLSESRISSISSFSENSVTILSKSFYFTKLPKPPPPPPYLGLFAPTVFDIESCLSIRLGELGSPPGVYASNIAALSAGFFAAKALANVDIIT